MMSFLFPFFISQSLEFHPESTNSNFRCLNKTNRLPQWFMAGSHWCVCFVLFDVCSHPSSIVNASFVKERASLFTGDLVVCLSMSSLPLGAVRCPQCMTSQHYIEKVNCILQTAFFNQFFLETMHKVYYLLHV